MISTFNPPPVEFCAAVRAWLAEGEPPAAPELRAVQDLLTRLNPASTASDFERQLVRLAGFEVPLVSTIDARAAEVVLDLWQSTRSGALFARV